jgi:hypothetical protein
LKHYGYGMLKLKPDEFWNMTLNDLLDMTMGHLEQVKLTDDMEMQRLSWQTSLLMNATGNFKKKIKPTDLYKPLDSVDDEEKSTGKKKRYTPEEKEEYFANLQKKMGKDN